MKDSFKHFHPKKSLAELEKNLAEVDLKVGRKNKTSEELQGEAMEAFIDRNAEKEQSKKENIVEEKLDAQGEAMEVFIKNSSSDRKAEIYSKLADFSEKDREKLRAYGFADEDHILFEKSEDGQSILVYKIDKNGEKYFVAEEKNGIEISRKKEAGKDPAYTEGSEDVAEERAENTSDKDDEVVFEEVVEDEPGKRRSPEDIPVKEDGSYKEEEWPGSIRIKERGSDLEELQAAVEHARMGYAKKDYEVTSVFARIKKIFGGNLRSIPGNHPETHDQYNAYKIALTELLDYQVAQLKEKNLSPEESGTEMERLTKYYNQDEKASLYAARTDARAEIWEKKYGKAPGWIAKYGGKYINKYRKLNWKTKMAFGVGAVLSGAGLLVAGQRILSGAAAGVGVTAVMEARYRQKEEARLAQEQNEIKEKLEKIADPEEKYAAFMDHMQAEMDGYGKDLRTEKSKAFQRRMIGATAGIFIGSGALSHLIGWGHTAYDAHFGNPSPELMSSHISSMPHGAAPQEGLPANDVASHTPEVPPAPSATPEVQSEFGTQNVPEVAKVASAPLGGVETAQEGDSIWKMVARHFKHNTEFSALDSEQKTYVIDALKDRVASRPADFNLENIDKIKSGYELDFSKLVDSEADFNSIVEHAKHLTSAQLDNIEHNNESILHWVQNHPGQALDSPKVEEILSHSQNETPVAPPIHGSGHMPSALDHKMPSAEALADNVEGASDGFMLAPAAGLGAAIGNMRIAKEERKAKGNIVKFPDAAERVVHAEGKAAQKSTVEFGKMAKDYKLIPGEEAPDRAMKLIKSIAINSKENWNLMKGAKFPEWKKGVPVELVTEQGKKLTPKLTKNIGKLVADMLIYSGDKMQPKAGETVFAWIARVSKNSSQAEKVEDLQQAA